MAISAACHEEAWIRDCDRTSYFSRIRQPKESGRRPMAL